MNKFQVAIVYCRAPKGPRSYDLVNVFAANSKEAVESALARWPRRRSATKIYTTCQRKLSLVAALLTLADRILPVRASRSLTHA